MNSRVIKDTDSARCRKLLAFFSGVLTIQTWTTGTHVSRGESNYMSLPVTVSGHFPQVIFYRRTTGTT